jgi:muconolactone D-isomerase
MNKVLAIFTIHTNDLPANFQDIIKHEQEVLANWKRDGLVDHLFLRQTKNGAVIVFNDIDETKAKQLMESLPLYQFVQSVEYYNLIEQF